MNQNQKNLVVPILYLGEPQTHDFWWNSKNRPTLIHSPDFNHIGNGSIIVFFTHLANVICRDSQCLTTGMFSIIFRKVTPASGQLSFERFCAGLKICLLRNQADKSRLDTSESTVSSFIRWFYELTVLYNIPYIVVGQKRTTKGAKPIFKWSFDTFVEISVVEQFHFGPAPALAM